MPYMVQHSTDFSQSIKEQRQKCSPNKNCCKTNAENKLKGRLANTGNKLKTYTSIYICSVQQAFDLSCDDCTVFSKRMSI